MKLGFTICTCYFIIPIGTCDGTQRRRLLLRGRHRSGHGGVLPEGEVRWRHVVPSELHGPAAGTTWQVALPKMLPGRGLHGLQAGVHQVAHVDGS